MKRIFIYILFWFSVFLQAQDNLPKLSAYGLNMESFVPTGWNIIAKTEGDLNKDNSTDFAFVIEKNELVLNETTKENENVVSRILAIYLRQRDGIYLKHTQSNTFIISRENAEMNEPFQGIFITSEGYLDLNFQIWKKDKLWFIASHSFRFALQGNNFNLVTYSLNESNRNNGETTDYMLDFINKRMVVSSGNFLTDVRSADNISKLKEGNFKTLESLGSPFKMNIWD